MSGKIINLSDNLNYNENKGAAWPSIQVYNDELYCAWYEDNGSNYQIKIKKYNGGNWSNISSNLNYGNGSAYDPIMQVYKGELYCVWREWNGSYMKVNIKKYDGNTWSNVSSDLNYGSRSAYPPTMQIYKDGLYCAWSEYINNDIRNIKIKKYNGGNWSNVSSNLGYNSNNDTAFPYMQVYKDELYCVWSEYNNNRSSCQIKIKKYDGNSWSDISSNLNYNVNERAEYANLQVYKDELYCVWSESNSLIYQIKMKKYNGNSWANISNNLNYGDGNAYSPSFQMHKNELYCVWHEKDGSIDQIKMKKCNGITWTNVSNSLNYNGNKDAQHPTMQVYKDELYCIWHEKNTNDSNNQIKMKKYISAIEKYLINQNLNYYSIKSNLYELGQSTDNTQLKQWYEKYGYDNINILTKNLSNREMPMTLDKSTGIWQTDFELDANQVLDDVEMIENDHEDNYKIVKYISPQYKIFDELKDKFKIMMSKDEI